VGRAGETNTEGKVMNEVQKALVSMKPGEFKLFGSSMVHKTYQGDWRIDDDWKCRSMGLPEASEFLQTGKVTEQW
jgi:hypothetical protein